jgi:hypothetical protein
MAIMMWLVAAPKIMGDFVVTGWAKVPWRPGRGFRTQAQKWPTGLARQPMEAKAFYAVICIATIVRSPHQEGARRRRAIQDHRS